MNKFLFDIDIVKSGWMRFSVQLRKSKIEFLSSNKLSGDMTGFIDACVYFHPSH